MAPNEPINRTGTQSAATESAEQLRSRVSDLEASVQQLSSRLSSYDRVFFQSPIPVIVYDANTLTILEANEGALQLYESEPGQFCSLHMQELFQPEASPNPGVLEEELRKPVNALGPAVHRTATGKLLLVRMAVFTFHLDGGRSRIAVIEDETARVEAEEASRASEERYRELFENANDVIFLQDFKGTIVAANRAAEYLTGYSRSELVGQDFAQLLPLGAREQILDSIRAHLGGTPSQRYELEIVPKTGQPRYLEVSSRIIYSKGTPVSIQGIGRDVTEWKLSGQRLAETARELKDRNEELSTALRMAQEATQLKEQFLANTSHELRTPMNGIMGMTNLLKDTALDEDQREYIDSVGQCANDLLSIINDLLDMSQIEAGRLAIADEPMDLRESLKSIIKLIQIRARAKGLALEYNVDQQIPGIVYGDPVRFRQILTNLIANAVKFTNEGGVRVSLTKTPDGDIRVEVVDSGIGVEDKLCEKIFEPFFQADGTLRRRYGGTGLGLSISKQLVEIMGGHIGMANNTPGPGATFWFEIPARTAPLGAL